MSAKMMLDRNGQIISPKRKANIARRMYFIA
jgi:hypothetical protein